MRLYINKAEEYTGGIALSDDTSAKTVFVGAGVKLQKSESVVAYSRRKPNIALGVFLIALCLETIISCFRFHYSTRYPVLFAVLLLCSAVGLYEGVYLALFVKNRYVFVTDRRILYTGVSLLGKTGKKVWTLDLHEIERAKKMKSSLMITQKKDSCEVILYLKSQKTKVIPKLYWGDVVVDAINRGAVKRNDIGVTTKIH